MKLEIKQSQVWVSGKYSEHDKCEAAAERLTEMLDGEPVFNESDEDDNTADFGVRYDSDFHTIEQVKKLWKAAK